MAMARFLVNRHVHALGFFVGHNLGNLGGLESFDDVLNRVFVPAHHIDAFAGQLVGHGRHARAADADAGADGFDALVMAHHGNLGTGAGITGRSLDFHGALFDFRHFELKELLDEFIAGARQDNLLALVGFVDAKHVGADAIGVAQVFARNHFALGQAGFQAADFDDGAFLVRALDLTGDHLFIASEELIENLFAFGVTQALQDDLLGVLGKAAAGSVDVFNRLFNVIAHFEFRIIVVDVREHFFAIGLLQALIVAHDYPAANGTPVARVGIDANGDVSILTGKLSLLHSACQRDFEYAENGGFFNVLFACKDVDHIEHFAAHSCFPLKSSSAIKLARSTSLMPNVTCTGSALGLAALPDWRDLAA